MPGVHGYRFNGEKTRCANGHPFDGFNIIHKRRQNHVERVCRECRNYQERARRRRLREKRL